MPTLTPSSESSSPGTPLTEDVRTLTQLAETAKTLTELDEDFAAVRLGFYPDTVLYSAPYPYPSSTTYPGATTSTGVNRTLTTANEETRTLTPLTEN